MIGYSESIEQKMVNLYQALSEFSDTSSRKYASCMGTGRLMIGSRPGIAFVATIALLLSPTSPANCDDSPPIEDIRLCIVEGPNGQIADAVLRVNVGKIDATAHHVWDIQLENGLADGITIENAIVSCRCTGVKIDNQWLGPGDTRSMSISLLPQASDRGDFRYGASIAVLSGDRRATLRLIIEGGWAAPFRVVSIKKDDNDDRLVNLETSASFEPDRFEAFASSKLIESWVLKRSEDGHVVLRLKVAENASGAASPVLLRHRGAEHSRPYEQTIKLDLRKAASVPRVFPKSVAFDKLKHGKLEFRAFIPSAADAEAGLSAELIGATDTVSATSVSQLNKYFYSISFDGSIAMMAGETVTLAIEREGVRLVEEPIQVTHAP